MLNEDQASCEKLFVKKPTGKHRNSTLLEDNGVSEGQTPGQQNRSQGVRLEMSGGSNNVFESDISRVLKKVNVTEGYLEFLLMKSEQ